MFNGKEVRIFLRGQGQKAYLNLKKRKDKESQSILNSFERLKEILKENPQFGEPISKNKIPKKLQKLGIKNLYRAELSNYWRLIYTIEGNQIEILLFVLNIFNHKDYSKFFGYKK
jgi:mRNA-degrading endonuclease RelE of RelBE toxin-antitoxin system